MISAQHRRLISNRHLSILSLKNRQHFNKGKFAHRRLTQNVPPWFWPLVRSNSKRNRCLNNCFLPKPKLDSCKKSLTYSAAHLWSTLPWYLTLISDTGTYNIKLHRYMFNVYFMSLYTHVFCFCFVSFLNMWSDFIVSVRLCSIKFIWCISYSLFLNVWIRSYLFLLF